MAFNSVEFGIFLATVLAVYFCLNRRAQNIWLLGASYLFYAWWDWRFTFLIAFSTIFDYFIALRIQASESPVIRKRWLLASLVSNLSILGFFKYFNFFAESVEQVFAQFGAEPSWTTLNIVLPVGISFYTFQSISYTVDVYRREIVATRSFTDFALYIAFFPQLVAGPIERPNHLIPEIERPRRVGRTNLGDGVALVLLGLFKKVILADHAAFYVNRYFADPSSYSSVELGIGVYLFAIQIYGDFSGYTDIARGCAKLLGFELMRNFEQPYLSSNITLFWRRWHISLSTWLRDYLYIPLGGNRKGNVRTYVNLMLVMLLGGLWHGASWAFVIWGALHGTYLAVHKWLLDNTPFRLSAEGTWMRRVLVVGGATVATFHLVCFAWIFFRAGTLHTAVQYLQELAALDLPSNFRVVAGEAVTLLCLGGCMFLLDVLQRGTGRELFFRQWPWGVRGVIYAGLVLAIMLLSGENETAFIYFQF